MTSPFPAIAKVHPELPGWCSIEKAITLASLVIALRPAVTVEIGIFGGSSLIPMALAHKSIGRGIVFGIDPWNNLVAVKEQTTNEDREWWSKLDIEGVAVNFLSQITKLGLEPFTNIIRNDSKNVTPPKGVGLLHVDGSHGETAITDIARYAPNVIAGGFVVLDDLNWAGGAVSRGEQRLLSLGFKKLYALGTGAVYQRA